MSAEWHVDQTAKFVRLKFGKYVARKIRNSDGQLAGSRNVAVTQKLGLEAATKTLQSVADELNRCGCRPRTAAEFKELMERIFNTEKLEQPNLL